MKVVVVVVMQCLSAESWGSYAEKFLSFQPVT
jgi:hypothetical protein